MSCKLFLQIAPSSMLAGGPGSASTKVRLGRFSIYNYNFGFEIPLATCLSKFGGSLSIPCAFLRRSFLKHLQISDGVAEWNENFWVVRIGKLFHTKSFTGCTVWSSVIAIMEKNWPNPLVMVSLYDISSSFTLNVVLVSFDFGLERNVSVFSRMK